MQNHLILNVLLLVSDDFAFRSRGQWLYTEVTMSLHSNHAFRYLQCSDMYSNMYISWWVYFVTGSSYVLQQPSTAGRPKQTQISRKKKLSFLLIYLFWPNWPKMHKKDEKKMCTTNWASIQNLCLKQTLTLFSTTSTPCFAKNTQKWEQI